MAWVLGTCWHTVIVYSLHQHLFHDTALVLGKTHPRKIEFMVLLKDSSCPNSLFVHLLSEYTQYFSSHSESAYYLVASGFVL